MDKLEPTKDRRCGTTAGHRAHRDRNEVPCRICKDATNARHRQVYDPDKNRLWVSNYDARHKARPEVVEAKRLKVEAKQAAKVEKSRIHEEAKAQRAAQRLERIANSEAEATRQRVAKNKILKEERAKAKTIADAAKEEIKKATALKIAERKKNLERARLERQRPLLIKNFIKLMNKRVVELKRQEREAKQLLLINQHGTSPGDYDRCRKRNGVACALCKAAAAKYAREKFHSDPKYKEAEKRWKEANPHKVYKGHKDRALKNGGKHKYYTRQHIFDRDGYDCYLCNTPIDLTAPHTQGQPGWETYPHIEHVIPLSKGGDDVLENVKIAHAKCNIDKGTKFLSTV